MSTSKDIQKIIEDQKWEKEWKDHSLCYKCMNKCVEKDCIVEICALFRKKK